MEIEADLRQLLDALERGDADAVQQAAGRVANPAEAAEIWHAVSEWHAESGDRRRSLDAAASALEALGRDAPEPRIVIDEIVRAAELLADAGDARTAIKLYEMAIDLTRRMEREDAAALPELLERLAVLLGSIGERDKAEDRREEAEGLNKTHRTQVRRPSLGLDSTTGRPEATIDDRNTIPIYFATHRNVVKDSNVYRRFGGQRTGVLNVGVALVSIPKNRTSARFILPPPWARSAKIDSDDYFILKDVRPYEQREWLKEIRARAGKARHREILLFVHGFNQSFWQAMLRAAQLGVDLEIDGVTAAYSWPSRGSLLKYSTDRAGIAEYAPKLKDLIAELAGPLSGDEKTGPRPKLYIIAHSMGCDYTVNALKELKADFDAGRLFKTDTPPISELILGAPDIDAGGFRTQAPAITSLTGRTTVYCSERDIALRLSRQLQSYRRAGQKADELAGLPLDAIDTTTVPGEWLWHTDFASSAIDDVKAVLWHSEPPERRSYLAKHPVAGGAFFMIQEQWLDGPDGRAYMQRLAEMRAAGVRGFTTAA